MLMSDIITRGEVAASKKNLQVHLQFPIAMADEIRAAAAAAGFIGRRGAPAVAIFVQSLVVQSLRDGGPPKKTRRR